MKSILITFDQAFYDKVVYTLDHHGCRGFTYMEQVQGRGSKGGGPHFGSHAWPSLCSAIIAVVHDIEVEPILNDLHAMDIDREQLGLRAFVWNIEKSI
jgi:nitrogen regulatory protein PII